MYISGRNEPVPRLLNENDLESVTVWFQDNKRFLNVLKTNCMTFGTGSQTSSEYSEYDLHNAITKISCAKFVGIVIDENWGHINHIIAKTIAGLFIRTSITALCCEVLNLSADPASLKLAKKKCIRNICNNKYNEHTSPLF